VFSSGALETVDLSALATASRDIRLYSTLPSLGRVELNRFNTSTDSSRVRIIATVAGGAGITQDSNCASSPAADDSLDDFEDSPEL
jgi:hypothetical protein